MSAAGYWQLARWLGPWADEARAPEVTRREIEIPPRDATERPLRAWIYAGARPRALLFLIPGLHYAGPADPRMDRFARVLAGAGIYVFAPFLPDFCALRLEPSLISDADRAFSAFLADPDRPPGKPGVFSISFGSLPALRLAAARPDEVGGVLIFGGYAQWDEAMQFCMTGAPDLPHDPLNRPICFINMIEHLPGEGVDRARVVAAWRRYIEATWGRPEMKVESAWQAAAREVAGALTGEDRALFLRGCGLGPGVLEMVETALARAGRSRDYLDPRPHLASIKCPVYLVHGADDDVIPYQQSKALADAMPPGLPVRRYLTGLYGHTGHAERRGKIGDALREGRSMVGILRAIVAVSKG